MRLANPIYDVVFKYLMEDTEIARRLLGRIIGEEITEIVVRPQESSRKSAKYSLTIYRLDFKATIKTKEGEYKTVLIELQKAKQEGDLLRFRRYVGENYRKEDEILIENGEMEKVILPIITIYFLGFRMPPIKTSILKVNRVYKDLITNRELDVRTEFIEKLTHDSYVILIPELPLKERTELERLFKVFNQSYKLGADDKLLEIAYEELTNDELLLQIAERLRRAAMDEEVLRGIEIEEEVESTIDKFVREKEAAEEKNVELKGENVELKGENVELKERLQKREKDLEELQRRMEELKKQLEDD